MAGRAGRLLDVILSIGRRILFVLTAMLLVGCDHASKHWAEVTLRAAPHIELVPGALDLRYTQNSDVAFSLLRRVPESVRFWIIVGVGIIGTVALFVLWARQRRMPWVDQLGWALIFSGAVGNLLDRIVRGHVIDFIHLHHWPVFNVADVCIVSGSVLLAWVWWRRSRLPGTIDAW